MLLAYEHWFNRSFPPISSTFKYALPIGNISITVISNRFFHHYTNFIFHFCSEKSAVSQSITWLQPVAVKQVNMDGTTAFAVSGLFLSSSSLHNFIIISRYN